MSHIAESTAVEDLRNYAISRIYLDNFDHLKAYWPMIGRNIAQLSLAFGVDDIDGTIDDTTKIYSMAGSEEQHPSLSTRELVDLIRKVGRRRARAQPIPPNGPVMWVQAWWSSHGPAPAAWQSLNGTTPFTSIFALQLPVSMAAHRSPAMPRWAKENPPPAVVAMDRTATTPRKCTQR